MKVIHVASEMFPYIKTGGLADVVGSLTKVFAAKGHEVSVFIPGYRSVLEHPEVAGRTKRLRRLRIEMGDMYMSGDVRVFSPSSGLKVYLICREEFFDRKLPYGNGERDYEDNHHRFIFFCKAVVETMRAGNMEVDVVHGHDWQTGLLPLLLRAAEERHRTTLAMRTVFTVHNIAFQGLFPMKSFYRTNLPEELTGLDGVEFYGQASMMKAGLLFADRVTTVSPRYAEEIQTPEFGCGLDGVVQTRADDLVGMINGIDTAVWNPAVDPVIPSHFTADDLAGKTRCRAELLRQSGFDPKFSGPIFGMVCRLTEQKGVQLLLANRELIEQANLKLVVIGSGEAALEAAMNELAAQLPDKVAYHAGIDERASHLIEAGSDFFLMPSLFEPCGLNQMYSQNYGTIPVVAKVGGLVDTVIDIDEHPKTGTGIMVEPTAVDLAGGIRRALDLYARPAALAAVQERGMRQDFSWAKAAEAYEVFYENEI